MGLPDLARTSQLDGFEAHMLQRAVKNAVRKAQREERDRKVLEYKDEARRMQEHEASAGEPCAGGKP